MSCQRATPSTSAQASGCCTKCVRIRLTVARPAAVVRLMLARDLVAASSLASDRPTCPHTPSVRQERNPLALGEVVVVGGARVSRAGGGSVCGATPRRRGTLG